MLLKPCKNNLLVQFILPTASTKLILPGGEQASSDRVKCKVLAVSKALESDFAPGNFLYLRPNHNFLHVDKEAYIALIDSSVVEAIVLDDAEEN